MTNAENTPSEAAAPPPGEAGGQAKKKKGLFLGGGAMALIALAWALSLVAVPSGGGDAHAVPQLSGPFMADVSPSSGFQVNLAGDGGKHYLSLKLSVELEAFDEAYVHARTADPLHQAKVTDAVLRTAAQKTKGELDSAVGREVFREELRVALDPVLFPVHVGDRKSAESPHAESGLRPGLSSARGTLRALFGAHSLHVDAPRRILSLDRGPETSFRGDENDLFVVDGRGRGVYVDVSALKPDFTGEVPLGTLGRLRGVYFNTFLTQ